MSDLVCSSPSHAERKDEAGWEALLGTTDGDEPTATLDGVKCEACARLDAAARAASRHAKAPAKAQTVNDVRAALDASDISQPVKDALAQVLDVIPTDTPS